MRIANRIDKLEHSAAKRPPAKKPDPNAPGFAALSDDETHELKGLMSKMVTLPGGRTDFAALTSDELDRFILLGEKTHGITPKPVTDYPYREEMERRRNERRIGGARNAKK